MATKILYAAIVAIFTVRIAAADAAAARRVEGFDRGWRFSRGEAAGAEAAGFGDGGWRAVDLPHDWSIAGPFAEDAPTRAAGGFLPAGVGWYRKHFSLAAGDSGKSVWIEFDGVMANSDAWINGFHLGHRPSGSASFAYDLTGRVNLGLESENVLAVRVDNSREPASRWYAGAGIYRHVRLVTTSPIHVERDSLFVTTPAATADEATVRVTGTVLNPASAPARISARITLQRLTPHGEDDDEIVDPPAPTGPAWTATTPIVWNRSQLAATLPAAAGGTGGFSTLVHIPRPDRWEPGRPALYQATVALYDETDPSRTIDDQTVTFGIRDFKFDSATGFWINGRNLKLKGVCLHDDAGALGAAAPLSAWSRRLAELRRLGANAIRTAHNPPDPGFLDLCDRMGFLVMDEFFDVWTVAKEPYDYHLYFREWSHPDEAAAIRRDRNHPSVVLWSVGNEIHDTPHEALAKEILAALVRVSHDNDPTRPVTQALFRPNVSHDYANGLADMLDVIGTNYRYNELLAAHAAKPSRKIIGTENHHTREEWLAVRDHPEYAGEFLWTGVDYLGEAGRWPTIGAGSGLIDRTATPRATGYELASWWAEAPMVKMYRRIGGGRRAAPGPASPGFIDPGYGPTDPGLRYRQVLFDDWTPATAVPHEETIEVYSNCENVALLLNGHPIPAAQGRPADLAPRVWHIRYEAGVLEAVGYNGGRVAARDLLRTAGTPAGVLLRAEEPNLHLGWEHVGYVSATVVDSNGVRVPNADPEVSFHLSGPGEIIAVDNGDNRSHEPFQGSRRKAYQGACWCLVRATSSGTLTVSAGAPGLAPGSATLSASP